MLMLWYDAGIIPQQEEKRKIGIDICDLNRYNLSILWGGSEMRQICTANFGFFGYYYFMESNSALCCRI